MKYTLARLGVLSGRGGLPRVLGAARLLRRVEAIPLGLLLRFDLGRVIVVGTVPGAPAQQAGLRARDHIAAVDGHPIVGRLDWMTVVANLDIGRSVQLTVHRDGGVTTAAITPEIASWQAWRSQHGPELLMARVMQLVTLLLALLIATRRSHDARALVGAAFLATIGVFSLTLPDRFASVWRALPPVVSVLLWVPFMSSVAVAGWGFSFCSIFPRGRFRTPLAWCAVWALLVPGLVGHGIFGYYTIVLGRPSTNAVD